MAKRYYHNDLMFASLEQTQEKNVFILKIGRSDEQNSGDVLHAVVSEEEALFLLDDFTEISGTRYVAPDIGVTIADLRYALWG